jgi:hypothetical protein
MTFQTAQRFGKRETLATFSLAFGDPTSKFQTEAHRFGMRKDLRRNRMRMVETDHDVSARRITNAIIAVRIEA